MARPEQSVSEILSFYQSDCLESSYLHEIRRSHNPAGMLSKLISLPTLFCNLTGSLTASSTLPELKCGLYRAILSKIGPLAAHDQISIINKLLTLKE